MKIFLDTSSLIKLYHFENGSQELMDLFKNNVIETVFLSEISLVEFDSAMWRKFRKNEIDKTRVETVIKNFEKDSLKFSFINDDRKLKISARNQISKYGKDGLRTLDSIQLATAILVHESASLFLTSDLLLQKFFVAEQLPV